uniref:Thioredoxin domain-containing 9 n=1 Tax=Xenopus tropicalis TaxID=8364 RepID=A0A803JPL3_XENTR
MIQLPITISHFHLSCVTGFPFRCSPGSHGTVTSGLIDSREGHGLWDRKKTLVSVCNQNRHPAAKEKRGGKQLRLLVETYTKMAADTSVDIFAKVMENQLLQTAKIMEEQLDAELEKLDKIDEDEMDRLKERRLEALKKAQQQKQEWLSKGHGEYREIPSEREFFQEVKESKNVVCHFYKDSTFSGNLMEPPFQNQKKYGTQFTMLEKKTIRGKKYDSDSDDD